MAMVGRVDGRGSAGEGRHDDRGDVFPALGAFILAGMVLGGEIGIFIACLEGSNGNPMAMGAIVAGVGTILGLFVGLSLGAWRPGLPTPTREPKREPEHQADTTTQLWDPWLDSGRDAEWTASEGRSEPAVIEEPQAAVEGAGEPIADRAPVRPRVISPETGEAILLEDEVGTMIQAGRSGLVAIVGGPGSGKTTALKHLATILPPWAAGRVRLVDHPDDRRALDVLADELAAREAAAANRQLIILVPRHSARLDRIAVYRLSAWGQDDLIEYLLAAHRDRCASVMERLRASGDRGFLNGIPELWTIVLDRMARDESIGDLRAALRAELAERLDGRPALRRLIEDFCLDAIRRNSESVLDVPVSELPGDETMGGQFAIELARLFRHQPTALLLAADRLADTIGRGLLIDDSARRLPLKLVQETARRLAGNVQAIEHLNEWLSREQSRPSHPLAASLLHALTPGWRPDPERLPCLAGAYLDGVAWSGLNLAGIDVRDAALKGADLSATNLEGALADRAHLSRADLHGASLTRLRAERAYLRRADLRWVTADQAGFRGANLADALLIEANLWKADLRQANIEFANFTGANLEDADLSGLSLRLARFDGARFGGANLIECNLEEMKLTDADFHDAHLFRALLTSSTMPNANFRGANLREAGLADVDWPGACLRDANLQGANFHLGSSRNGLVGSPIACEGSRTGFYTDDYHDQDVKPVEEIRKANLRGADLRGAVITDVDFYLVDLRDAHYTEKQAEHLRRCRAILDDRTR